MKVLPFLALAVLPLVAVSGVAETFYVAPSGNDAWEGRTASPTSDGKNGPLASLIGARDAIRRLGPRQEPITVIIADGVYALGDPLLLDPRDSGTARSPITYEAAPGAHPVISGGRRITGWQAIASGLWKSEAAAGLQFEQLWVNGRRATRARIPLEGLPKINSVKEIPISPGETLHPAYARFNVSRARQIVSVDPEILRPLEGLAPADIHQAQLLIFHKWNMSRRAVDSIDPATGMVAVSGAGMQTFSPWFPDGHFYLENVRAGLELEGRWFHDRDGALYYRPLPGETIDRIDAVAPVADQLLIIAGAPTEGQFVQDVTFRGLAFEHSQWLTPVGGIAGTEGLDDLQSAAHIGGAIQVDGGRRLAFEGCEIAHTGRYGIWIRRGCRDIAITRCRLYDLGAGGIKIGDVTIPRYAFEQTGRVTVSDTQITQGGRIFASAAGIWIGQSDGNRVSHNLISDFFHNGISVGWSWRYEPSLAANNLIEYNRIDRIGQGVLSDIGGIYTLSPSPGTVIRNNVISNVTCAEYGGFGIYTDEGSSGILIENNLVYLTENGGYVHHYGKDNVIRNNIFAFGSAGQIMRGKAEAHVGFTFTGNIVYWRNAPLLVGPAGWSDAGFKLDDNLYFDASGRPVDFAGRDLKAWRTTGQDQHSLVADPLFVAPEKGDFHLRPGSPAAAIGFKPFDYEAAGPTMR